MRQQPTTRFSALMCWAIASPALVWPTTLVCAQADKADGAKGKSGIELVGRSEKEKPLYGWFVDDAKAKKRVASEYGRWGFTAVPPGEYVVVIRQDDREVPFATVRVEKDKVT